MFLTLVASGFSVSRTLRVSSALSVLGAIALLVSPSDAADWPSVEGDPAGARIQDALNDDTRLEFIETPLEDVVAFLKDLHGIELQIDSRALEDVGIADDTPVTRDLKGITLRSALRLMLKELDLTYVLRDEVLLITTPEEAESDTAAYVQVYNIQPLLDEEHGVDALIDTVKLGVGKGSELQTSTFRGLLVVRATSREHREVRRLLGVIGAALDVSPPKTIAERDRERPQPMARPARREIPKPDAPRASAEDDDPFGIVPEPEAPAPRGNPFDPFDD